MGKVLGSNPGRCIFALGRALLVLHPPCAARVVCASNQNACLRLRHIPLLGPFAFAAKNAILASPMIEKAELVRAKLDYIDELLTKLESKEAPSIMAVLRHEMEALRALGAECVKARESKTVVRREEKPTMTRYYLKDGSVYAVRAKDYRYLYDAQTKTVVYEFANGQIERTFENGIKEIRKKDGRIIIKNGAKDYDYIN